MEMTLTEMLLFVPILLLSLAAMAGTLVIVVKFAERDTVTFRGTYRGGTPYKHRRPYKW